MASRLSSTCLVFSLLVLSMCASPSVDECSAASKSLDSDRESLLQLAMKGTAMQDEAGVILAKHAAPSGPEAATCSPLANMGSHFTVKVEVGTPPQSFDLVADTGSNNVIVASCVCQDRELCDKTDRCFRGTKHSKSFLIDYIKRNGTKLPANMLSIQFGSGTVEAAVATDFVKVGKQKTKMSKSLLLMIGKMLDFEGPFEGILGLGLPKSDLNGKATKAKKVKKGGKKGKHAPDMEIGGFLETARVPRFGVCFNPGEDGVLRIAQAPVSEQLGAVGQSHWSLSYSGYSLGGGDKLVPSPCSRRQNKNACVAIPDSGTTLIMAPKFHIMSLFASICSQWKRCKNSLRGKKRRNKRALSNAFQKELLDCNNFTSDTHGLEDELPAITFELKGSNGKTKKLSLPGVSYVYETMEDELKYVHENLFGIFPVDIPVKTGKKKKVCTPAFGAMNMQSGYKGPVWILGQPIFYEFQVGYEINPKLPTMSFTKEPCGSCDDGVVKNNVGFVEQRRAVARRPVLVRGPARMPSIDLSGPV